MAITIPTLLFGRNFPFDTLIYTSRFESAAWTTLEQFYSGSAEFIDISSGPSVMASEGVGGTQCSFLNDIPLQPLQNMGAAGVYHIGANGGGSTGYSISFGPWFYNNSWWALVHKTLTVGERSINVIKSNSVDGSASWVDQDFSNGPFDSFFPTIPVTSYSHYFDAAGGKIWVLFSFNHQEFYLRYFDLVTGLWSADIAYLFESIKTNISTRVSNLGGNTLCKLSNGDIVAAFTKNVTSATKEVYVRYYTSGTWQAAIPISPVGDGGYHVLQTLLDPDGVTVHILYVYKEGTINTHYHATVANGVVGTITEIPDTDSTDIIDPSEEPLALMGHAIIYPYTSSGKLYLPFIKAPGDVGIATHAAVLEGSPRTTPTFTYSFLAGYPGIDYGNSNLRCTLLALTYIDISQRLSRAKIIW